MTLDEAIQRPGQVWLGMSEEAGIRRTQLLKRVVAALARAELVSEDVQECEELRRLREEVKQLVTLFEAARELAH